MEKYYIKNYRGFNNEDFLLSKKTIFTGQNGIGKTSLIKMIHLLKTTDNFAFNSTDDQKILNNSGKEFKIFHYSTKKEEIFEYYKFKTRKGRVHLCEYATYRKLDIVFFKFNSDNSVEYSILNNALKKINLTTIKNTNNFIKNITSSKTHLLPFSYVKISNTKLFKNLFHVFMIFSQIDQKNADTIRSECIALTNNDVKLSKISNAYIADLTHEDSNLIRKYMKKKIKIYDSIRKIDETTLDKMSRINKIDFEKINYFFKNSMDQKISIEMEVLKSKAGEIKNILVNIDGETLKIDDVGDGLSQIIPLLARNEKDLNIYRQPELHLHPKMVAEFGSFIFKDNEWILESHSKEIIDRIRYELSILDSYEEIVINTIYKDISSDKKKIESIIINQDGRIPNAIKYLEFFSAEEMKWF